MYVYVKEARRRKVSWEGKSRVEEIRRTNRRGTSIKIMKKGSEGGREGLKRRAIKDSILLFDACLQNRLIGAHVHRYFGKRTITGKGMVFFFFFPMCFSYRILSKKCLSSGFCGLAKDSDKDFPRRGHI